MTQSDAHPAGWTRQSLAGLATVHMGQSPPGKSVNDTGNGVPFLQGNAEFGTTFPTATHWCTQPGRIAEEGDLLISVRAPVGELNIADQKYCIGRGLGAIRIAEDDRAFLWAALHFERRRLNRVSQGSTFDAIGRDDLEQLPLLYPPMGERRRIAEMLGNVDTAIDATREVIEQSRRFKTAVLQDLLTRGLPGQHSEFREVKGLGQVPRAWKHTHIRELCTDIIDCPHTTPNFVDAGVPVIRTSAVRDGVLIDKELTYTSESEYATRTARLVPEPGDIVFTREAPVGEAFVIPEGMRLSLGQRTMLLRPDPTRLDPHFFVSLLYEPRFRRRLLILGGGSTNPHLNVAEVRDLSIATPPIPEQRQITRSLNSMSDRIAIGTTHLGQLRVLKTALSQALLTGRVRVPADSVEAV